MFGALFTRSWPSLPGQCAICRSWPARTVCDACVAQFAQPQARCHTCALLLSVPSRQCGQCLAHPPPLDACHTAVTYGYPWSECISRFKFNGQPGWASVFATLLRSAPWVEPELDAATWIVPMPLSAARLQARGFNQAHEIARRLAPRKARGDMLVRQRDTPPQHELGLTERAHNMQGAIGVSHHHVADIQGARMVLVDDVMTTGASLHAAASALRTAGAAQVCALVVARTEPP